MTHSLLIITLLLAIILLTPIICRKIHIPVIVGFIVAGIVFGPHALNWIDTGQQELVNILGQLGMLYIMFQAGIEIDRNDFHQLRGKALLFGLYTFFFPVILGLIGSWVMGYNIYTCFLLAAMYGSHTLMTYPIVTRYGIQKIPAVNIVVGGTMVATVMSLVTLALVKNQVLDVAAPWWDFTLRIAAFLVTIGWLFPKIAHWVFKRWQDQVVAFMLVMLMLVLSSWLADIAGLDAILGAFLCGVALNGLVPNRSETMRQINFIGTGLFVPLFLISIGMIIDIGQLTNSAQPFIIAAVMIGTKLTGKWLASLAAQGTFKLTGLEQQLMFGLTHATAAGTLAIVTIGFHIGVFDIHILNGAVLMILFLSTLASFVTEHAAKQIALQEQAKMVAEKEQEQWLLIAVGEDKDDKLEQLITLSDLHKPEIRQSEDWLDATNVIEHDSRATLIYHETQPINTISRILVAVPKHAEKERDFISCFGQIRRLSGQIGAKIVFYATSESKQAIRALSRRKGKYLRASFKEISDWEDILLMAKEMQSNDLIAFISARPSTASYNPLFSQIPGMLERFFITHSYLILYPEQNIGDAIQDTLLIEHPQPSRTWRILTYIKNSIIKRLQYERK